MLRKMAFTFTLLTSLVTLQAPKSLLAVGGHPFSRREAVVERDLSAQYNQGDYQPLMESSDDYKEEVRSETVEVSQPIATLRQARQAESARRKAEWENERAAWRARNAGALMQPQDTNRRARVNHEAARSVNQERPAERVAPVRDASPLEITAWRAPDVADSVSSGSGRHTLSRAVESRRFSLLQSRRQELTVEDLMGACLPRASDSQCLGQTDLEELARVRQSLLAGVLDSGEADVTLAEANRMRLVNMKMVIMIHAYALRSLGFFSEGPINPQVDALIECVRIAYSPNFPNLNDAIVYQSVTDTLVSQRKFLESGE